MQSLTGIFRYAVSRLQKSEPLRKELLTENKERVRLFFIKSTNVD